MHGIGIHAIFPGKLLAFIKQRILDTQAKIVDFSRKIITAI